MKTCWILALLCCGIPALALSGGMEKATVHAMRKVPCKAFEDRASHIGVLAEIAGTGGGDDCIEYELRSEKVSYVVRPRRTILLLLGADVYIRLVKDELLLRSSELPKDIHCAVIAMSLRSEEENTQRRNPPICLSESGDEIPCAGETQPFP